MEVRLEEVERPKSVTHGTFSALSRTFSGLRSRWMILCACTASMPRAMPASSVMIAAFEAKRPSRTASSSAPPAAKAITRHGGCSMHAPYSRTTFEWRTRASARTSRRTACVIPSSAASLVLRWSLLRCFLIATGSP